MKNTLITSIGILSLLVILAAIPATAQHPGTIKANIPFDFAVGEKTLPAGDYTIMLPSASGTAAVSIKSADGTSAYFALANPVKPTGKVEELGLIFVKNGDRNFLYQVFVPGVDIGQELLSSKKIAKRQLARVVVLLPTKTT